MNVNKIAIYVLVTLTGMMVASLAAYYLLTMFGYTKHQTAVIAPLPAVSSALVDGTVTNISIDPAPEGTAIFTVTTKSNETKMVKVTKLPAQCAAVLNMVEISQVTVGDELLARGLLGEDGSVTPCADVTHYLKAVKVAPLVPVSATTTASTSNTARMKPPTPAETITTGKLKVINFTGKLESINTGCFADGECFAVIDGKHITVLRGWSQSEVGSVQGVEGFGDLEQKIGKTVEVYAQDLGDGTYSLYGSQGFYIKVLP